MEVDYTNSRKVPGLGGLPLVGDIIWKAKGPVEPFGSCYHGTRDERAPAKSGPRLG